MHAEISKDSSFARSETRHATTSVDSATDFTGTVKFDTLQPDTVYQYRVWFARNPGRGDPADAAAVATTGTFRTAPSAATSRAVSFIWGGDVGGQSYCRRVDQGYAIFGKMQALAPDFFIANGDMIYADGACPADGPDGPGGWQNIPGDFPSIADPSVDWTNPAQVRDVYLKHWRYNRADPHHQQFLQSTSMYAQWDDHEVINDFGAQWTYWNSANIDRAGFPNLVAAGRRAFFEFNPIARNQAEPGRIYRSFSWGKDMDLFILDARSYRSRNDVADTPENNKTLLGAAQLEWLKEGLKRSTATWKVVSSDVPMSVPTGSLAFGRDAFANGEPTNPTGFERELRDLLLSLDRNNVKNVVFVTTDVHFATTIRYQTDVDADGDMLVLHELVSGPINAVRGTPGALDPTFNPTALYAEGNLFNFGYAHLARGSDGRMHLLADIRGEDGQPRPGSAIDLTPE